MKPTNKEKLTKKKRELRELKKKRDFYVDVICLMQGYFGMLVLLLYALYRGGRL